MGNAVGEIAAHDQRVVEAHGAGNHHRPDGVGHAQVPHHQIGGNQTAAEVHGHQAELHEEVARQPVLARKRISAQHRHDHVDHRAEHGVQQAVAIADPDGFVVEQLLIALERKPLEPDQHVALPDLVGIAERGNHHKPQRPDEDEQQQDHDDDVHRIEDFVRLGVGNPVLLCALLYHSPSPVAFLASVLAKISIIRLITVLNSPTAVE